MTLIIGEYFEPISPFAFEESNSLRILCLKCQKLMATRVNEKIKIEIFKCKVFILFRM